MPASLDETRYLQLVAGVFRRVEDALETVDPEDVDLESRGDVLTLTLKDGVRCVLNTQRPTSQIWLAAKASAWHFDFDAPSASWRDSKHGTELFAVLREIIRAGSGIDVTFSSS